MKNVNRGYSLQIHPTDECGLMYTSIGKGVYECHSISGFSYTCDIQNKKCTCKAWQYGKRPCKHLKVLGVGKANNDR